ncbi:insertion element IS2 transposase InsD [Serratia marcescens]|nr:insertion element IS2 transposase InsD [Serratia marcescens]
MTGRTGEKSVRPMTPTCWRGSMALSVRCRLTVIVVSGHYCAANRRHWRWRWSMPNGVPDYVPACVVVGTKAQGAAGRSTHSGKVAVNKSNRRWCSDGFEFRCDNGEKLRVTFALDCCDREALHWAAGTGGFDSDTVQDVMLGAVERRFGQHLPPDPIEWLTDNAQPTERMIPDGSPGCWGWNRKEQRYVVRRVMAWQKAS